MNLPVMPPVKPMLAKLMPTIPAGMRYEPKWDGFRCIVFRDGDEVEFGSRNERPLTRYFPEVVAAVKANLPPRCVLDGEIVTVAGDRLDFETLLQRIHPATSRIERLSRETPASFVAFDLLALGDDALLDERFDQRRGRLERALADTEPPVLLTPATADVDLAGRWFQAFEGAGLDGVVAKAPDLRYLPDQRVMVKVKHERTADCVVAGFRWHRAQSDGGAVGSLMLGLYDAAGGLQHVGVCGAFSAARRQALVDELAPYRIGESAHPWHEAAARPGERRPGGVTRWNAGKDLSWVPLRPELVCEVAYDHMEGGRFRHTAQFRHWRPDREPRSCTYAQLDTPAGFDLAEVLRGTP